MTVIDDNQQELPQEEVQAEDLTRGQSETTFNDFGLSQELVKKLETAGITKPMPVQEQALQPAMSGSDLLIQARTGSGKTLAFVLPLVAAMEREEISPKTTYSLIIAPTRELALQIKAVFNSLTEAVKPVVVIGGVDIDGQIKELREDARVVIGTPGRILDLIRQKALKLKSCRYFVLDEADETLSMGFLEDVRAILNTLPDRRQGLFVSATITPRVEMLASSFLSRPKRVMMGDYTEDVPAVSHYFAEVGGELMAKPSALCDLIEAFRPRSAIIFCNTKSDTQLVEALLRRRGFDARRINSDLSQNQRNKIMNKIRNEELQILVATDLAARGLDIEQIDLVINYSTPEQPEGYIHRTGRTGRAGRTGKAISLIGPRDVGSFHFLTKVLEIDFQKLPLPTDDDLVQARVSHLYGMLREKEIDLSDRDLLAGRKIAQELGGLADPPEELSETLAKLCRYTMEHFINLEARSLDEELEPQHQEEEGRPERGRGEGRERDRDQDRRRDGGQRERGRDRDERRGGERRGDDRRRDDRRGDDRRRDDRRGDDRRSDDRRSDDRRDDRRGGERRGDDRRRDDRRRDDRRDDRRGGERNRGERWGGERGQERGRGRRGGDERRDNRQGGRRDWPQHAESGAEGGGEEQADEIRLYIGQGLNNGMTSDLFRDLAMEFAELKPEDLRKLTIREHYGFVDLYKAQADILVQSLNGIEYNGTELPIEYAGALTRKPERPRRR